MESKSPELKSYTCTNCGNNVWSSNNKPVFGRGGCFAVQGHDYQFNDPTFEGETMQRASDTFIFNAFPKIPRLNREIVITEKIDGTNSAIGITENGRAYAQSRKRVLSIKEDNFGFAEWVETNKNQLIETLGVGLHFGEWWGSGVQRGYGLSKGDRRFSLFNVARWEGFENTNCGLAVVPTLYQGTFDTGSIQKCIHSLNNEGSVAAPGFMDPEGIIVFHSAADQLFKVTIKNDELPKGQVNL
jgi:hypothetical protein